jgi:Fe-Mn family superoxide dismutase
MHINNLIKKAIAETLEEKGLSTNASQERLTENNLVSSGVMSEAYVAEAGKFNLKTELLSDKTKKAHQELLEGYVENLNKVSAKLDGVDKSSANLNHSDFRNLKVDETYNHNAAFLHGMYFENISDLNSQITVDSLTYMKLARDFGTFDKWQEDFVACCLSARNGWAVTFYNPNLKRYMNTVIDLHSQNVMISMLPVVVMDCWEHSYYRDYLKDRKTYVYGMMKEIDWSIVENRVKLSEKIAKVLG